MKDLRDPQALGERIQQERQAAHLKTKSQKLRPLSQVIDLLPLASVPDYDGGGLMSNDPAKHHSRTSQVQPVESDGGE